jgi:hypothetical protein
VRVPGEGGDGELDAVLVGHTLLMNRRRTSEAWREIWRDMKSAGTFRGHAGVEFLHQTFKIYSRCLFRDPHLELLLGCKVVKSVRSDDCYERRCD